MNRGTASTLSDRAQWSVPGDLEKVWQAEVIQANFKRPKTAECFSQVWGVGEAAVESVDN